MYTLGRSQYKTNQWKLKKILHMKSATSLERGVERKEGWHCNKHLKRSVEGVNGTLSIDNIHEPCRLHVLMCGWAEEKVCLRTQMNVKVKVLKSMILWSPSGIFNL